MIDWRFKHRERDDMSIDPIQGEFFTTRDIDNISTALIREGIQNALDERIKENLVDIVKVRIFLSTKEYSLYPNDYLPLLGSLLPHLNAKGSGLHNTPDFNLPMQFLVFEDFNTKGLEGDPKETYVHNEKDEKHHNFYYFWRNVGRSGKSEDQLGRWGLGKTVFPASSRINTFWGITVRNDDKRKMLMGQSILRIHTISGEEKESKVYMPYGMYGSYSSTDYFCEPIESNSILNKFESLFGLQRKDQPGFSIIVPFLNEEITINHLAYSAIEQYFFPILGGKLEVELLEGDNVISFDKGSVLTSISKINFESLQNTEDKKPRSKESLLQLFDFAMWTFSVTEDDFFILSEPATNIKPKWAKNLFSDEVRLNNFREKYENNERLAFRIPLKYQPVGESPKICWYEAFIERDTSLSKAESLFVRDGITISGISPPEKGLFRGLVTIHDHDLAKMLGDSENPAHTEWQSESRNFKGKYVDGKEALVFVKNTLRKIYETLQRPVEGLQKDLLIDFFAIPLPVSQQIRGKNLPDPTTKGQQETDIPIVPEIKGNKKFIRIEKIRSGVKIDKNPEASDIPELVSLKLGYDVPRGDPIKSYQELDFDVSKPPIRLESSGVYFIKRDKNELLFEIENKDYFEILVLGFDEKRDLYVKLK